MKNIENRPEIAAKCGDYFQITLAAMAIATLFGSPVTYAEPMFQNSIIPRPDNSRWIDNYVELGVGAVKTDATTGKAFKFGEFTGLKNDDPFAIAGFNWLFRSRENDSLYLRTHGSDLALDTRKFSVEGGRQGGWDLSFSADRLLRAEISPAQFIHDGLGGSNLTNPGAAGANVKSAALLKTFDIEQGRDIFRLGARGILAANWDIKVNYREDVRDGNRLTGVVFSTGGAATVPYEINDKTQQIDVTLGYRAKAIEGQLTYAYSRYENQLDRFRVENNHAATGNANPTAQLSLMPDNEYHQLTATGVYNLSRDTRAKAQLSYGVALQNDNLLPYNSAGTNTATVLGVAGTALPQSIDAKVIHTVADLSLMTRPVELMNVKLGYQYRDMDNRTPRTWVNYYSRDTTTPPASNTTGASTERRNAPLSSTEQKLLLDTDYQIAKGTQVRGLLEHTVTDYTLADVSQTKTNKASLDLRRIFSDELTGNLGYIYTQRTGSTYDKNTYFRETYNPVFANGVNGLLTNHPSMRSFMFNDFDENRLRSSANWITSETLTLGASVDGYDRKYKGNNCNESFAPTNFVLPDTCLGTRQSRGGNANFDLQWQPEETLLTFAFATIGQSQTKIDQRNWGTKTAASLGNESLSWNGDLTYTDQTVGFGSKWQVTPKWELGGQYVYSVGKGKSDIQLAVPNAFTLPDMDSKLHNLNLYAKWVYNYKYTVRLNYLYEKASTNDWAYDGFNALSNANLVMTGQTSPKYENHVIGVSVAISAW